MSFKPLLTWAFVASHCWLGSTAFAANFITNTDSHCAVWAPWSRGDGSSALRFTGPCVNGKAEGAGKAQWMSPYRKDEVDETWTGQFRQGVFIADQHFKGSLQAWPSDVVLSDRGTIGDARMMWVHRAPSKGPIQLCEVSQAALLVRPGFKLEDDDLVQGLMKQAHQAVIAACPSNAAFRATDVVLWQSPLLADNKGDMPPELAKGSVVIDAQKAEVRGYRNDTASAKQEQQAASERTAQRNQTRQAFHRYSAQQGVYAWLSSKQADKDPFKWQGKSVGMAVQLERMLSPTVAWVSDAEQDAYGYYNRGLLLTGVNSDTFGKFGSAMVVGQLDGRKKSSDLGVSGQDQFEATVLQVKASQPCLKRQCDDWLDWDQRQDMKWGEPFKATTP